MEAGRELDALIEEKVMGMPTWAIEMGLRNSELPPQIGPIREIRFVLAHYSTSIAAVWEVVEKLVPDFSAFSLSYGKDGYCACFKTETAWAETAPHAICLAALKAVNAL